MSGHITRMSRGSSVGSSCKQAEQHLAQHVDLAGRTVTAVHLHGAVVRGERAPLWPNGIGGDVGLQPAEQRVGAVSAGQILVGLQIGRQAALQFAQVAPERRQQRMAHCAVAGVLAAGNRAVGAGERLPQLVAGVRQPQVQVVVGGQRVEQLDVGARQPGVPEQRQPRWQVAGPLPQPGDGLLRGGCAGDRRRRARPAPATVRAASAGRCSRSLRVAVQPVDEQLRPLAGVGGEQPGQPARHRVAPALAQLGLLASMSKWPRCVASVGTTARRGCSR